MSAPYSRCAPHGDADAASDSPDAATSLLSFYIAGPMTGIAEFNFPAFDAARDWLISLGHGAISPADIDRAQGFDEKGCNGTEALTEEQRFRFARNDMGALLRVNGVVVLDGWQRSTGARNEVMMAGFLGLPVMDAYTFASVEAAAQFSGSPTSSDGAVDHVAGLTAGAGVLPSAPAPAGWQLDGKLAALQAALADLAALLAEVGS